MEKPFKLELLEQPEQKKENQVLNVLFGLLELCGSLQTSVLP